MRPKNGVRQMRRIGSAFRAGTLAVGLAILTLAGVIYPSAAEAFSVTQVGYVGSVQVPTTWGYDSANYGSRYIYFPTRYAWRAPVYGSTAQSVTVDYFVYMDTPTGSFLAAHGQAKRTAQATSQGVWLPEYWAGPLPKVNALGTAYHVVVQVTWATASVGNFGQQMINYDAQGDHACAKVTYYVGAASCSTTSDGWIVMR